MELSKTKGFKKRLEKFKKKKIPDIDDRWQKTKKEFDEALNVGKLHEHRKLDFKPYQSVSGAYQIRLLSIKGNDGGYRIYLTKVEDGYEAYLITEHPK